MEKINGSWYLFDANGWMLYDWKKRGDNWYYLGSSDDGAMKTGWQKIDDKWYYFDESGVMKTGWIRDKGKDYWLSSDGSMIYGCELYGYSFDEDGVAVKLG